MQQIKITIEKSKDAYWAYAENVEGINGGGDTIQEAKDSALECIEIQKELGNWKITGEYEVVFVELANK